MANKTVMTHLIDKILRMPESNIKRFLKIAGPAYVEAEKEEIKDAFVECWKSNVLEGIECKLSAEEYYIKIYGK